VVAKPPPKVEPASQTSRSKCHWVQNVVTVKNFTV